MVLVHPSLSHLQRAFTYAVPDGMTVDVGSVVRVPVRGRSRAGVVVELLAQRDVERTVPIKAVLGPGLPPDVFALARWTAERYLSTLGEALAAAVPDRVASEEARAIVPAPDVDPPSSPGPDDIARAIASGRAASFVWRPRADERRGETITGLVASALARGAGALVLVPEVNIDSEVVSALRAAIPEQFAWLGSDRSHRLRYRDWLALHTGAKRLASGGRGAVFAPVRRLGLVVVDDEGHAAYKEGRAPRFHARALAAERARAAGATLVLVGVPPSIEARAAVESKALQMVAPSRNEELRARPPVTVIDLSRDEDRLVPSSRTLAIARRAARAGHRVVVLTHRGGEEGRRVAARVGRALGSARTAMLDARSGADALVAASSDADLIVATPYVAKDLAVTGVGVLAIVDADAALSQPEFRAQEETFATWWHASRWASGGQVVIETNDPHQPAIAALARWDPEVLWRAEASRRTELGYPPFASIARIDVPADRADAVAAEVAADGRLEALGPVQRRDRTVVVARARRREELLVALRPLVERWREADEPMRVDVDPREVLEPKWRSSRSEPSATPS